MSILEVEAVGITFGGLVAVENVSFKAEAGQILSIIGPNGAGKTTLFNIVSGVYRTNNGALRIDGVPVTGLPPHRLAQRGMSRTFQNLQIFGRMTALENVLVGGHRHAGLSVFHYAFRLPGCVGQDKAMAAAAQVLLDKVGLGEYATAPAASMPYGALKRLEIARALACQPRILLLDEPAAGLNEAETVVLERLLRDIAKSGVALVLVEHDMKLVMNISDRVLVLDRGRMLMEGRPTEVARDPRVIEAYLGSSFGIGDTDEKQSEVGHA
ncbi:ABC transporter ATP-binding protein [Ferrovibrio sp.]|uniref:ABC transporter ATP-binding protein n=1 Tax=Ferrovibrio sp. TaxID=1917215 RepID=UPI00311F0DC2